MKNHSKKRISVLDSKTKKEIESMRLGIEQDIKKVIELNNLFKG